MRGSPSRSSSSDAVPRPSTATVDDPSSWISIELESQARLKPKHVVTAFDGSTQPRAPMPVLQISDTVSESAAGNTSGSMTCFGLSSAESKQLLLGVIATICLACITFTLQLLAARHALHCSAPKGIQHASSRGACIEGVRIKSGQACSVQCEDGYSASVSSLSCRRGVLVPASFACSPAVCFAPTDVDSVSHSACLEGSFVHSGENCTAQCSEGFYPSVEALLCDLGRLSPPTFTCLPPKRCTPPDEQELDAKWFCDEGEHIQHGAACTVTCRNGYFPSVESLTCDNGRFSSHDVSCAPRPCTMEQGIEDVLESSPCREGTTITSGSTCSPQCRVGFEPSVLSMTCQNGTFAPATFECTPVASCTLLSGISGDANSVQCKEGLPILNGSHCTPQCANGFEPSVVSLYCSNGHLEPQTVSCLPRSCSVPSGIAHANSRGPCVGSSDKLKHGANCTADCEDGYQPSVVNLTCVYGALDPSSFACLSRSQSTHGIGVQAAGSNNEYAAHRSKNVDTISGTNASSTNVSVSKTVNTVPLGPIGSEPHEDNDVAANASVANTSVDKGVARAHRFTEVPAMHNSLPSVWFRPVGSKPVVTEVGEQNTSANSTAAARLVVNGSSVHKDSVRNYGDAQRSGHYAVLRD